MSMNAPPEKPGVDLSGIFGSALELLQFISVGVKHLVAAITQQQGRFTAYAAGGVEIPLQKDVNGTMRSIHNMGGTAAQIFIVDGNNSQLVGSAANPVILPAGGFIALYTPFKAGLRATVGPAGSNANIIIGGDIN